MPRTFHRLHAGSLVSVQHVGCFTATRLIVLINGTPPLAGTFGKYPPRPRVVLLDRVAAFLHFIHVPDTRPSTPLITPGRFLVLLREIAHANASLPHQRPAERVIGPGQHLRPIEVISAADPISLQRPGQHVRPVEVANTAPAIALQRPREYVHSVELTDAHAAVALTRFRRGVEVADAHASVAKGYLRRFASVQLAGAGSSLAGQQFRRLADVFDVLRGVLVNGGVYGVGLRQDQELEIEGALRSTGWTLATREEGRGGADEHAVLPRPILTWTVVQLEPRRIVPAEDVESGVGAPVL